MAATQQQIEAIKLIGDWSKWMATIETGTIAVIGAFVKSGSAQPACSTTARVFNLPIGTGAFTLSILCFIISIWLIGIVLVSLPAAVQDIKENEKVWDRPTTLWLRGVPLWWLVMWQFMLFGGGIVCFGGGVIFLVLPCQ